MTCTILERISGFEPALRYSKLVTNPGFKMRLVRDCSQTGSILFVAKTSVDEERVLYRGSSTTDSGLFPFLTS